MDLHPTTTEAAVEIYESCSRIFDGLFDEIRELSKKKPEATLSAGKVKIINRVLADALTLLQKESLGKYLELLDDETLPQVSDAVLIMVQFEKALEAFRERYYRRFEPGSYEQRWITKEVVGK